MSAPTQRVCPPNAYDTRTLAQAVASGCGIVVKVIVPVFHRHGRGSARRDPRRRPGRPQYAVQDLGCDRRQAQSILAQAQQTALLYSIIFGG